jgi:hypothetical protein
VSGLHRAAPQPTGSGEAEIHALRVALERAVARAEELERRLELAEAELVALRASVAPDRASEEVGIVDLLPVEEPQGRPCPPELPASAPVAQATGEVDAERPAEASTERGSSRLSIEIGRGSYPLLRDLVVTADLVTRGGDAGEFPAGSATEGEAVTWSEGGRVRAIQRFRGAFRSAAAAARSRRTRCSRARSKLTSSRMRAL